ncbi:hypothetical protein [Nocardia sp. NRRL S-836]|uniref:hypothetical protein n=1 Tax=Nocardia sp. NRRL S-836 TaxID=1519492 RepID=UPI0006AEA5C3|nr:hypothetical protein [Nocardia sp. NRRL S-836]KOV76895.1 hypothetical protein ADL03_42380 [Nocardia sp. NRRL S-836]
MLNLLLREGTAVTAVTRGHDEFPDSVKVASGDLFHFDANDRRSAIAAADDVTASRTSNWSVLVPALVR